MIPLKFYLSQNYPNPFRDKTTIKYCIPYKTRVDITLYNQEGGKIITLVDEVQNAGTYEVVFDIYKCFSAKCGNLKRGLYTYELRTEEFSQKKSMTIENNQEHAR